MAAIQVGDLAPDFTGTAQTGETISLHDFRGKQAVVVYFYPADNTPGCTAQACAFRDAYQDFTDAGAVVIGISGDTATSHEKFATGKKLPFLLLSDADGKLRKAFGVPRILWLIPGRVTYVIDKQGLVQEVFSAQLFATQHVKKALETVKRLAHT
jgi:peroxiredoxin Q/BCP